VLVEDAVVRQVVLPVHGAHAPAGADGARVGEVEVEPGRADERDDPVRRRRDLLERLAGGPYERRAQEQVLGRVARGRELGEEDEVGARGTRLGDAVEDLRAVAVEVPDDDVDLGEGDPQGFRLSVTNSDSTRLAVVEIVFERRYRGPLTSANGGYACGRLAAYVDAPEVEVTLRLPPPLERPLEVRRDGDAVLLLDGVSVVAEARPSSVDLEAPAPVSLADARLAAARHVRVGDPVFHECFVCGIREEGDGLRVYAGPVEGREPLLAAPATLPEAAAELVWAAIDCPGAYAVGAAGRGSVVLGRMTARVDVVPRAGETCVAVAWPLGEDGRKLYAGTALFSTDGELYGVARQVWIQPR
jgi:hypothetical protein